MPAKLHRIRLSGEERLELEAIRDHNGAKNGKGAKAGKAMDALCLLLSDEGADGPGLKDSEIMRITGTQALEAAMLVHPAEAKRRLRSGYGGCA